MQRAKEMNQTRTCCAISCKLYTFAMVFTYVNYSIINVGALTQLHKRNL